MPNGLIVAIGCTYTGQFGFKGSVQHLRTISLFCYTSLFRSLVIVWLSVLHPLDEFCILTIPLSVCSPCIVYHSNRIDNLLSRYYLPYRFSLSKHDCRCADLCSVLVEYLYGVARDDSYFGHSN